MGSRPLTTLQARRTVLAAQGFTRPRPGVPITGTHLRSVLRRLGFFQIDSVNVLQRAHYVPLFSRVGAYDLDVFHRSAYRAPRAMFEYWAHVATYVDVELWPAMQHRMADRHGMWGGMSAAAEANPGLIDALLAAVDESGPITARALDERFGAAPRDRSNWGWNWSVTKQVLEYLFFTGQITSARRNSAFEREYDLPERVIPRRVLDQPALDHGDAHRVLVEHAARALGVATELCLRDYFRTAPKPTQQAVRELVEAGALEPVEIAGWKRPAFRHVEAATPRRVRARALLSPFDPLVFERERAERLFDFTYRIEIYVPAEKRVHGYYVLPFLLGDAIVARVDLKADRAAGRLLVNAAFAEPHAPADTAAELADELRVMASWLGLGEIEVGDRGDLAGALAVAVG